MKKRLGKIIACILATLMVVGLCACKGDKWQGTTMTNWGAINPTTSADGGFLAETENYYYFINGFADNTADNAFGAPVKGALMAADKTNLDNVQVVVPKLFAATDYGAGVYIFGDAQNAYVYYGTPSTDKNNAGEVANTELVFMRTSLDGKTSETFFTVDKLSTEYRFVEANDTVYLLYYSESESALKCYNTATKEDKVVAKTDTKTNVEIAGDPVTYESLNGYIFNEKDEILYTVTVYTEQYYDSAAEKDGYVRTEASYNRVYKYVAGSENATLVFDGKASGSKKDTVYSLQMVKEGYLFYTETPVVGEAVTYVCDSSVNATPPQKIKNTDIAVEVNVLVDLQTVYYAKDGVVYKASLFNDGTDAIPVAKSTAISALLFVEGNDIYFIDSDQRISRLALNDEDADQVRVSEDMVATSWYSYEIIENGGNKYIAYLGGMDAQTTYVNYVELKADYEKEDTDGDEKDDYFYLTGHKVLGKMLATDEAAKFTKKVDAISSGALSYEVEDNGEITVKSVEEARKAYDALSSDAKAVVSAEQLAKLTNSEKAIEIIKELTAIEEEVRYYDKDTSDLTAITTGYNQAKAIIDTLGDNYDAVMNFVSNNLKYIYGKAGDIVNSANN
ncbi:MAG: hypothetical protein IJZ73_02760 [Clostridia bacterium]|nr:hypothetical protein [Clostridia bacterium]